MAVGRISGPLLKANLERNGIDLAVETDLLYIDVTNSRLGVNTSTPGNAIEIVGTAESTAVLTTSADVGNVSISSNNITTSTGNLILTGATAGDKVVIEGVEVDANSITSTTGDLQLNTPTGSSVVINNNLSIADPSVADPELSYGSVTILGEADNAEISTNVTNLDLNFLANGDGILRFNSDARVDGNLTVTGDIQVAGNITIGDAATDTITLAADFTSNVTPDTSGTYDLGETGKTWRNLYVGDLLLTSNSVTTEVTDGDVLLKPIGSGQAIVDTTTSFRIPVGTTAQRPTVTSPGHLRWNTTDTIPEAFDGSSWRTIPFGQIVTRFNFTATAGQTTFTGTDDNGSTYNITAGSEIVTKNGLFLEKTEDYTTTNTTLTLNTAANTGDDINVIALGTFSVSDTVSKSTGGTFNGGIIVTGNLSVTNNATITNRLDTGGYVSFNGTGAIKLPVGTTAERPSPVATGQLRFNSDLVTVEAYDGTSWGEIGGGGNVVDSDEDTFLRVESSDGADNDEIEFFVAGTRKTLINSIDAGFSVPVSVNGLSSTFAASGQTTSTNQTVLFTFSMFVYGTAKAIIQATRGNTRHISELLVTHNGTTAEPAISATATEYGTVTTDGEIYEVDVDVTDELVRVLVTTNSSVQTTYATTYTLVALEPGLISSEPAVPITSSFSLTSGDSSGSNDFAF